MFSIEAALTIPLSMTVFIQGILFLKPLQFRIEKQISLIAEERISESKNQNLFKVNIEPGITELEINPQKLQEVISLAHDLQKTVLEADN